MRWRVALHGTFCPLVAHSVYIAWLLILGLAMSENHVLLGHPYFILYVVIFIKSRGYFNYGVFTCLGVKPVPKGVTAH